MNRLQALVLRFAFIVSVRHVNVMKARGQQHAMVTAVTEFVPQYESTDKNGKVKCPKLVSGRDAVTEYT
jgi:hypothetical protein